MRRPRRLRPEQVDELLALYQVVNAHLSTARTVLGDAVVISRLTRLVARANGVIHRGRPQTAAVLRSWINDVMPGAFWRLRRAILAATLVFVASALSLGAWLGASAEARDAAAPEEVREQYIREDFEDYYSNQPAWRFATIVFTNNARVSATLLGYGAAGVLPGVHITAQNGFNLGFAGGLFHEADEAGRFWGLILPHGLLELTALFFAAGAGMHLGWSWLVPGDRRRGEAFAQEARPAITVIVSVIAMDLVAAILEAWVTPAPLPTWARVGTGAAVWAAVCGHLLFWGPRSTWATGERVGLTGVETTSYRRAA